MLTCLKIITSYQHTKNFQFLHLADKILTSINIWCTVSLTSDLPKLVLTFFNCYFVKFESSDFNTELNSVTTVNIFSFCVLDLEAAKKVCLKGVDETKLYHQLQFYHHSHTDFLANIEDYCITTGRVQPHFSNIV